MKTPLVDALRLVRRSAIAALGVIAISFSPAASAAQVTVVWIGPGGNGGDGLWGVASNWDPAVVPNNGTPAGTTYRVVIDNENTDSVVTIPDNGVNYTVDSLKINAGDTLSLTFSANLTVVNSGSGTGTIINAGTIALGNNPGFTSASSLTIAGNVTLSGGGNIVMVSNTTANAIHGSGVPARLSNVDNTISGSGRIGGFESDYMRFINEGTVVATQSSLLSISSNSADGVRNTGTLRAESGGTLILDANTNLQVGAYNNTGGLVQANGGTVRVNRCSLTGGNVQVVGASELLLSSGTVSGGNLTNSTTGTIRSGAEGTNTIGGTVTNPAGGQIIIEGLGGSLALLGGAGNSYTNAGAIIFAGGTLNIAGVVNLTGGGTLSMGNTNTTAITGSAANSHLKNVDNTISGAGQIGGTFGTFDPTMRFTNQGAVIADQTNNLVIKATPPETGFTTSGTLRVNSGSTMVIDANTVLNQTAGSAIVNGTLLLNGDSTLELAGGTLGGNGRVDGVVNNIGGTVAPGVSPGRLTIDGDFTQGEEGTLAIEIAGLNNPGTGFDRLDISGNAALGGVLNVTNINGFTPDADDFVVALTAGSITGTFDETSSQVNYGSTSLTVAALPTTASRLLNISTRLRVLVNDDVLIGGFIITGEDPKKIIIRAIGPSLVGEGVVDALEDPVLQLFDDKSVLIAENDDWKDSQQAAIEASKVPPSDDAESAIVRTLAPGPYTAVVRGKQAGTGIGLVELFDLTAAADSQLANISSRGFVESGENVMIGGFIVGGGTRSVRVLIRALGPSLPVSTRLQNPTLDLVNRDGVVLRSNDNWRSHQESAIEATTIPPPDDMEAAIIERLAPAPYTAIVRGVDSTTGVALIEVFALP